MLDRNIQREMLMSAREDYPDAYPAEALQIPREVLNVNLFYLAEHGLVNARWFSALGDPRQAHSFTITAKGLDFIEDDGGLSAILGVVTIKLHEDSLKALLTNAVNESCEPDTVKARLIDQIKSLPADATKQVVLDAAKAGLAAAPSIAAMLGKSLGF